MPIFWPPDAQNIESFRKSFNFESRTSQTDHIQVHFINHTVYLDISCLILSYHMTSYDIIWHHMTSYDITWHHMISYDVIGYHITLWNIIWCHMISYDSIWCHMMSSGNYGHGAFLFRECFREASVCFRDPGKTIGNIDSCCEWCCCHI